MLSSFNLGLPIGNGTVSIGNGGSSNGSHSTNEGFSVGGTWGSGANATAQSLAMMEKANEFNREQAEINRKWQEKMSNTAYQRAMADLKKAGLNPILAYAQGGASTGSGATASSAMGQAYTDNYSESRNNGQTDSWGSSWEHSEMTSDLANQLSAITGAVTGLIDGIFGNKNQPVNAETYNQSRQNKTTNDQKNKTNKSLLHKIEDNKWETHS